MHRIGYANTAFLTDSRIAGALMDYARTLSIVGAADVVRLPGVDRKGALRTFELVIGPASQMISNDVDEEPVPMPVEEALEDLRSRRRRRLPSAEGIIEAGLPAEDPAATGLADDEVPAVGRPAQHAPR